MAASPASCLWAALLFLGFIWLNNSLYCNASQIELGSRLVASNAQTWDSDNGTFAFGFTPPDTDGRFLLGIWFAQLPGDKAVVWSANRGTVGKDAVLELDNTGNLILVDGTTTVWTSNTSHSAVEFAVMSESGNFMLLSATNQFIWQSFSHPSDTLLPNQPLNAAMELTSFKSLSHGGYYALKMLQQPTSLSLGLTYNLPQVTDDASSEAYNNYSYWSGPDISNVTGEVVAVLDETGSFGIVYGESANGAVYVYKQDNDYNGLASATNKSINTRLSVLRRLIIETNGNVRLYRWDNDVNGSRQWVPEWAAVSNPCDIAGICGNGVCNLDRSKANASCTCLPRTSKSGGDSSCSMNSSAIGNIASKNWVFSSVSAAFNLTLTSRLP